MKSACRPFAVGVGVGAPSLKTNVHLQTRKGTDLPSVRLLGSLIFISEFVSAI